MADVRIATSNGTATLDEGTLQALSNASHLHLLDIPRNITAEGPPRVAGRAIRATTRKALDAGHPDWHTARLHVRAVWPHNAQRATLTLRFIDFMKARIAALFAPPEG